jgi:predicted transcriptional regulator
MSDTISSDAKICYGLILSLSNTLGYSYATNEFISEHLGISIRTVQRYIKELSEAKLIRLEYIRNKRRLIYPIIEPSNIEKRAKRSKMSNYERFTPTSEIEVAKQEAIMKLIRGY